MPITMADELFRVFRVIGPQVLGRKRSRKLMREMIEQLAREIPENGIGPVIGLRRQAQQFLESGLREMERDRA